MKPTIKIAKTFILKNNKVLAIQNADSDKHTPRRWTTPGGHVEPNETLEAAAIREAKEETGLDITLSKKITTVVLQKEDCILESTTFLASCDTFDVMLSNEHQAFKWFDLDAKLPESLAKIKEKL